MTVVVCELAVLEPQLLKLVDDERSLHGDVSWAEADGLMFSCPRCWVDNGRSLIGTHVMICWRPHVGQEHTPRPGRWQMVGTSLADVSLVAGSSSIKIEGGCNAHFFVRNGQIQDMEGYTSPGTP